ncbi:hypothetical protein FEM48_Zijuj04G0175200 [Ziziphus jujuba var. spinosa]|nr:hypothetical protein FEM48_Zijuj04G0175200 [Ziziphus jujuba var. spinosa]
MKINGETFKLKTPIQVWDVVKDYPGHVLLDSEAVKHFGIRAKPMEPQQQLRPKKIYFLVELPKFLDHDQDQKATRRVRSGINMSAKDRLECLMLSRRSVSDLSMVRKPSSSMDSGSNSGPMRVKMRLPKSQVAKLMEESKDGVEVAEKIISLYMENGGGADGHMPPLEGGDGLLHRHSDARRKPPRLPAGLGSIGEDCKADKKRVSFVSEEEGEIRMEVGCQ